jgi:hypothetical protein
MQLTACQVFAAQLRAIELKRLLGIDCKLTESATQIVLDRAEIQRIRIFLECKGCEGWDGRKETQHEI